METNKFKIVKHIYYDKYGKEVRDCFTIEESHSFLWVNYWRDITHTECYETGCYKSTTEFKTEEDAKSFIRDILCKNKPYDRWCSNIVKCCNCE